MRPPRLPGAGRSSAGSARAIPSSGAGCDALVAERGGGAVGRRGRRGVAATAGDGRRPAGRVVRAASSLPEPLRAEGAKALAAAGCEGPPPWLFVHPGAGSPTKCWPAEAFAQAITTLAASRRVNVVVHAGPRRCRGGGRTAPSPRGRRGLARESLAAGAGRRARARHRLPGQRLGREPPGRRPRRAVARSSSTSATGWRPWWPGARTRTVTLHARGAGDVGPVMAGLTGDAAMKRRRSTWAPLLAGGVVIAAGFGVALVEVARLPKGSIWLVVGVAALLVLLIRVLGGRKP